MVSGLSLANKSLLLFGCAAVVILAGALSVPWFRTRMMIEDYQIELARQVADAWLADRIELGTLEAPGARADESEPDGSGPVLHMRLVSAEEIEPGDTAEPFLADALARFRDDASATEHFAAPRVEGRTVYRYARAIRESDLERVQHRSLARFDAQVVEPGLADPLRHILVVDRTTQFAEGQLLRSRIFIVTAGLVGSLLAILVFYFILTKLIFSPVRRLRQTAERVQSGDLTIRSQIRTGDELEELAAAFNTMLDRVEQSQVQLRTINERLDLKVDQLAEVNFALYESNRLKSEFLANVSHELRTPLNSIIGFAELLAEVARGEADPNPKRLRYLGNIITSGRQLLEMINDLLEMAKIEAGRIEVSVEQTSVVDLVETLVRMMKPLAEAKGLALQTEVAPNLPLIETDPGKLQQILYNFLSNAIKFTPEGGTVTISADRVKRQDNPSGVRLAVADTGPGIPDDMQDVIFEKFRQIEGGHTREHQGTGLGLAICRELAHLLGATVSFVSNRGRGATFFVDLPLTHEVDQPQPLMA